MPFIWTHILFSEEVIDASNEPYSAYDGFMKLGAQGPCLFTHYGFWRKKKATMYTIGKGIYGDHYKHFLTDLITGAKGMSNQVQAYVMGQITHYVLNQNAFPYIHYLANEENESPEQMKVIIDALMMDEHYNIKTWKNKIYKEIDVGTKLHEDITKLLHQTIRTYYPEVNIAPANYIQKAYRDLKLSLKLLSDPYGWKSLLLKPFRSYTVHGPVKTKKDYLNLNHHTWTHPFTKQPSKQSFVDLYNKSRVDGIEMITPVQNFWKGKTNLSKQSLRDMLEDFSHASAAE